MPSDAAAAAAGGASASSSDEDTSDEAFAARHAGLEAEEQQRFNSFAGEPALHLACQPLGWICVAVIGFADVPAAQRDRWRLIPTQEVEHFFSRAHYCHSFSVRHRRLEEFCHALNHRRHNMTQPHIFARLEMSNRSVPVKSTARRQSSSLWRDSAIDLHLFPQYSNPIATSSERH